MKHASGVGSLIQQRGPDAYLTEWDKDILKSFRALIVRTHSVSLLRDTHIHDRSLAPSSLPVIVF